jgi:hypothetical protein
MARSTDFARAPMLDFGPSPRLKTLARIDLLWPAFATQVIGLDPRDHRLNPLQKAVLGFCRLGINNPDRISNATRLHSALVEHILVESEGHNYLDGRRRLTDSGLAALRVAFGEIPEDSAELVPGHVFQDPFTGKWWPRVATTWPLLDRTVPNRISPDTAAQRLQPRPQDVFNAWKLHRSDIARYAEPRAVDSVFSEAEPLSARNAPDTPHMSSLAAIGEPILVYLTTTVFSTRDSVEGDWFVCDPFGLGESRFLREIIQLVRLSDTDLQSWIAELVHDYAEQTQSLRDLSAEGIANFAHVDRTRPFVRYIEQMEFSWTAVQAGSLERSEESHLLKNACLNLGMALEAVLLELLRDALISPSLLGMSPKEKQADLNDVAKELGFRTPTPSALGTLSARRLYSDLKSRKGTIYSLLTACLYHAIRDNRSSLRTLARSEPSALDQIVAFVPLRNAGAHASPDDAVEKTSFSSHRENLLRIIQILTT